MKQKKLLRHMPLLIMTPAIFIGVLAMYLNGVPPFIFFQNIASLILLIIISKITILKGYKLELGSRIIILIAVLFLTMTFFSKDLGGVHRWIFIGPISIYVSIILIPIILINLWSLLQKNKKIMAIIITIVTMVLIASQPDASALTAFVAPVILIWIKKGNFKLSFPIIVLGIFLVILSWLFLDNLEPVPYVEQILYLVRDMGIAWFIFGIISLIILPLPFMIIPPKEYKLLSLSIGIYYSLILLSTLTGNFPVPLMGYGFSHILGYFISITWLVKTKNNIK